MKRFVGHVGEVCSGRMWGRPQPEFHHSRQVLYRGYIANREHVLRELRQHLVVEDECQDAALFAGAHQLWGHLLNKHVLGEYALAVFVPETQTLLITRDGLGVQPIYYSSHERGISFASHMEELLRVVEPGRLDEGYLGEYLLFARHSFGRTPFQNISKLIPGRSVISERGQSKEIPTWELSQTQPVRYADDRDYEEQFRELLFAGVRQSLPADGKVWAELSGGLDSSSIVSAAKTAGVHQLETFSFIYSRHREADERRWIRSVIKKHGYPAHELDGDQYPPFSELPPDFYGEPNLVLSNTMRWREYQAFVTKHGVNVVLSGNGGDHVMIGDSPDPVHLADHLLQLELRRLWLDLRVWQNSDLHRRPLRYLFKNFVLRPALQYWRGKPVTPRITIPPPPWMEQRFLRRFSALTDQQRVLPGRGRSPSDQYFLERVWDFSLLTSTNAHQAVQSFEFRYPLLYRPLVEFLYAIPWEQKLSWQSDRHLQRRALRDILPKRVYLRTNKAGLGQPVMEGFRRSKEWFEMLAKPPRLVEMGLVDQNRWHDTVARARVGHLRMISFFLNAVILEWWLRSLDVRPCVEFNLQTGTGYE